MVFIIIGIIGLGVSIGVMAHIAARRPQTQICPGCHQHTATVGYVCRACSEDARR